MPIQFATLLKMGLSAKEAAEKFVVDMLKCSIPMDELDLSVAATFATECFAAIGFSFTITAEQLEPEEPSFIWPEDINIYVFNYNEIEFTCFEDFIVEMCAVICIAQKEHITRKQEEEAYDPSENSDSITNSNDNNPLCMLLELIAYWYQVYHALADFEAQHSFNRFEEPISLINFNLLKGLHSLRKEFRIRSLDVVCNRLLESATQGIFYEQSHNRVSKGLLDIFEYDFVLFYQYSPESLNVLYEVFTPENKKHTELSTYKRFLNMLKVNVGNKFSILTNFLVEPHMQQVYFATLHQSKGKKILIAVLEFLNILQSKLLSLDCFSQDFIEGILQHVLHPDDNVSDLAAELYVLMIRRKINDDATLKHIIEFYLRVKNTPELLSVYVGKLWPYMTYLQSTDEYFNIIGSTTSSTIMRLMAAHFFRYVYEQMEQDYAKYCTKIEHVLCELTNLFSKLSCIITKGILLKIFEITDFQMLNNASNLCLEIVTNFECYAFHEFKNATNLEYPLLFNLLTTIDKCLNYTGNWHKLEECCTEIYYKFLKVDRSLQAVEIGLPSNQLLHDYCCVLQKLNVMLMLDYNGFDSIDGLYKNLHKRLIETSDISQYATKTNSFIDAYAIEILTLCVIKSSKGEVDIVSNRQWISSNTQQLEQYLLDLIDNVEDLPKMSIVRIKAIFNSLTLIYCTFNSTSTNCVISLDSQRYRRLVEILILINFETTTFNLEDGNEITQQHTQRVYEYQKLMLNMFINLHCNEHVRIPSNIVWKVCIYYNLPTHNNFNTELGILLHTLASKHFEIYKHSLSVLVYNLYKRSPPLDARIILNALKAHKSFIDNELNIPNKILLNVHIVLIVLEIIEKSLTVLAIDAGKNRLQALKHLNIFVENINLSMENVLPDILQQVERLKKYPLNADERNTLRTYCNYFAS